jgi:basic amino acid/polyamine antiporter, APA family
MSDSQPDELKRVLSLPLVVLYGLGIAIGAGIYVLVGETAAWADMLAPFSFILAAIVMLFPALCFAELSRRLPFASGATQFVEESFGKRMLGLGLLVMAAGLIAASTISLGSVRYLSSLVELPPGFLLIVVVSLMGFICTWGIKESVIFASVMTLPVREGPATRPRPDDYSRSNQIYLKPRSIQGKQVSKKTQNPPPFLAAGLDI